MTDPAIERIAKGLHPADAKALCNAETCIVAPVSTLVSLAMQGLADFDGDALIPNEKGLAVRAYLEKNQ